MTANTYDSETIYDAAIRLYGDLRGIEYLISQVDDITVLPDTLEYEKVIFSKFVVAQQPVIRQENVTFKVRDNQSIYDIALQMTGKVDGIVDVLKNYTSIDEDIIGTEITLQKNDDEQLEVILRRSLVFATRVIDEVVSNWILATGTWNDSGVWIDTENWID